MPRHLKVCKNTSEQAWRCGSTTTDKNLLSMYYIIYNQPSELVRTILMRLLKQSVVGEKAGRSMLSLDVDNTDNRLKHDLLCDLAVLYPLMLKEDQACQVIHRTAKKLSQIIRLDYVGRLTDEWKIYHGQEIPED